MATGTYGKNFTTNGAPASAGTDQTRQDYINEGLPGVATTTYTDPATNPTRGRFDTYKAIGYVSKQVAQIDTSGTSGLDRSAEVKQGLPSAW